MICRSGKSTGKRGYDGVLNERHSVAVLAATCVMMFSVYCARRLPNFHFV